MTTKLTMSGRLGCAERNEDEVAILNELAERTSSAGIGRLFSPELIQWVTWRLAQDVPADVFQAWMDDRRALESALREAQGRVKWMSDKVAEQTELIANMDLTIQTQQEAAQGDDQTINRLETEIQRLQDALREQQEQTVSERTMRWSSEDRLYQVEAENQKLKVKLFDRLVACGEVRL